MNDTPEQDLDAALEATIGNSTVRYLKRLVTAMTLTTILGLVVLVGVVVMRFSQTTPQQTPQTAPVGLLSLPDSILLPEGHTALSFTQGSDWYGVVTDKNLILIYDGEDHTLRQTLQVKDHDAPAE